MTRREFLRNAAALTAFGPGLQLRAATSSIPWEHRIVRAHDPLASVFDVVNFEFQAGVRDTYYGNFVNPRRVQRLLDLALCGLTQEKDPAAALRKLIPYQPGERVFIKTNFTTTFGLWGGDWDRIQWDAHYNDTDSLAEPIMAVIQALVRINIPQELIGVGDPTWTAGSPRIPRLMPNRVARKIHAAFPGVVLYRSSLIPGGDGFTWKNNHRDAVVTLRDPALNNAAGGPADHRLPDQLILAHHFINLPVMKRNAGGGVTGALKNNFGTIASCQNFHSSEHAQKNEALYSDKLNPAVDIWLNPHVGAKTRLIVADGILAGWDWGGNPPTGWKTFSSRSPNCLLVGTDPVAMDSVIFDQVTEGLPEKVKNYRSPAMLVDGAKMGLGHYESRSGPKAGYRTIDYLETAPAVEAGKMRQLAELKDWYLEGDKSAADVKHCLAESQALQAI